VSNDLQYGFYVRFCNIEQFTRNSFVFLLLLEIIDCFFCRLADEEEVSSASATAQSLGVRAQKKILR
jgi:hypothetical protein